MRLVAALLCVAAVACVAPPVLAQPYGAQGGGGRGIQLRNRADQLEQRVRQGLTDGALDRREADRALAELTAIRRLQDTLLARDRGALTQADRQQVLVRLDQLDRSIRWRRNNDRAGQDRRDGAAFGYGREFWNGAPRALSQRVDWLEMRVRRGVETGALTRTEADRAGAMLREFRRTMATDLARGRGRLSDRDGQRLSARLETISQDIRWLQTHDRRR
jgi:hypothetical protein